MSLINLKKGITIVEAVVAIAIFSIIVGAAYQIYIGTNQLVARLDHKATALSLAEEGIEATRSIRDQNFSILSAGTKGLSLSSNTWQFSGINDITNGYVRKITLSSSSTDLYTVQSQVDWNESGATSSVLLSTQLSNWHKIVGMSSGVTVDTSLANLSLLDTFRLLTGINISTDGSSATTTISKVLVSWTGVTGKTLQQVRSPNLTTIWTGTAASGATTTLTTPIVLNGATSRTFQLRFSSGVSGGTFTIVLIMSDGTTSSFTIANPPTGL